MNIILFEELPEKGSADTYLLTKQDPRGYHILKILKLEVGDSFIMGLINGAAGKAVIQTIHGGTISFVWNPDIPPQKLFPVSLLVGYVRPICMRRILREAVSLGVESIWLAGTDTGEKSYRQAKLWKDESYRRFMIDGAQQAGVTALPSIRFFPDMDSALAEAEKAAPKAEKIVLDSEGTDIGIAEALRLHAQGENADKEPQSVFLAIGSERGWTERERELFASQAWTAAGLGRRILRTETACAVGLGLLLSAMGFLNR